MVTPLFIERLELKNYKSIEHCDLKLHRLMFLVGPNGSGKSNILDALRFVKDALAVNLGHAIEGRGGINEVRRRSSGHPNNFSIKLNFNLDEEKNGYYQFKIGVEKGEGFQIREEKCTIYSNDPITPEIFFEVSDGQPRSNLGTPMPAALKDRLYLVNASGLPEFRPVYEALSHMAVYNINPQVIREYQPPDPGDILKRDGSNIASVLDRLKQEDKDAFDAITEYLSKIVPGILSIETLNLGNKKALAFRQEVQDANSPWTFYASSMSDGTLRAIGVLTALFQSSVNAISRIRLVGIEEPEIALHPGTAGLLLDSLRHSSVTRQVIVTSHSPDLLDNAGIEEDSILSVESFKGKTVVSPLSEMTREILRDKICTPGELLRQSQLQPVSVEQDSCFSGDAE